MEQGKSSPSHYDLTDLHVAAAFLVIELFDDYPLAFHQLEHFSFLFYGHNKCVRLREGDA